MTRKTDKTDLSALKERLAKPPAMTWIDAQKVALRLLDKEVAALHEAGFEVADDFRRSTPEQLERVGVRAAAANRILEAAGVLGKPSAPVEIKVALTSPDVVEQIKAALADLTGPARLPAISKLRGLGVERGLVDARRNLDPTATMQYLEAGAPPVEWWGNLQVVDLASIGPRPLHHPKSGVALTPVDLINWRALGRDGLVVAAAIYLCGLDAGESERAILADVQASGPLAQAAQARLAALRELRRRAEAVVDGTGPTVDQEELDDRRDRVPPRTTAPSSKSQAYGELLRSIFSSDELRRCLKWYSDDAAAELPGGTASPLVLCQAVVEITERRGFVDDVGWWRHMGEGRERRRADIRAVASLYGVLP